MARRLIRNTVAQKPASTILLMIGSTARQTS